MSDLLKLLLLFGVAFSAIGLLGMGIYAMVNP